MQKRKLGRSGLEVSPVCFGGNVFGWTIDEAAKTYNTTPTQISLAWLMARQSITAPIVSATKVEQLNEIIKASELKLDPASIQILDQASAWDK